MLENARCERGSIYGRCVVSAHVCQGFACEGARELDLKIALDELSLTCVGKSNTDTQCEETNSCTGIAMM